MGSQNRRHSRMKCSKYCILMGRDGKAYEGTLDNISLGGALVMMRGSNHLQVGDLYDLMFSVKSVTSPVKYAVKIVRVNHENTGVSFYS